MIRKRGEQRRASPNDFHGLSEAIGSVLLPIQRAYSPADLNAYFEIPLHEQDLPPTAQKILSTIPLIGNVAAYAARISVNENSGCFNATMVSRLSLVRTELITSAEGQPLARGHSLNYLTSYRGRTCWGRRGVSGEEYPVIESLNDWGDQHLSRLTAAVSDSYRELPAPDGLAKMIVPPPEEIQEMRDFLGQLSGPAADQAAPTA